MNYPSYLKPIYEFLSTYHFDDNAKIMSFRLGNENFTLNLFQLNYVFHFLTNQEANIQFDKDEL